MKRQKGGIYENAVVAHVAEQWPVVACKVLRIHGVVRYYIDVKYHAGVYHVCKPLQHAA